jgi:hypothetical protein
MKGVWKWSLSLSLGLLVGGAPAEEAQWRPVAQPAGAARPAASLARPVAQGAAKPAAAGAPAATLSRPVAVESGGPSAITDTQLEPASFTFRGGPGPAFLARGQNPDGPSPMPVGPPPADDGTLKKPNKVTAESGPVPDAGPAVPPADVWGLPSGPAVGLPGGPAVGLPGPVGDAVIGDGGAYPVEADSGCLADGCCVDGCHHLWVRGEYLMWWFKNSPAPPLLTGSLGLTGNPGALGDPGTTVLFGGGAGINTDTHSGARFSAGYWFDDQQCYGVEGSFFFLGQRGTHAFAGSTGFPGLFRPFFSPSGASLTEEVAGPLPPRAGLFTADLESRLWGAEVNFRHNLWCCDWYRLDLIEGFRFVGLDETLQIAEVRTDLTSPPSAPILVTDRFRTSNRFYGAQVGALQEFHFGRWYIDVNGKVALGSTHQVVDINGSTSVGGGPPVVGGFLAQASNIGHFGRERFCVVPEVGMNVGYQITDYLRLYVGYNFLYMSSVVRPGDQIDQVVSRPTIPPVGGGSPPGARPRFAFQGTDFWAQGVNFGLEFRY